MAAEVALRPRHDIRTACAVLLPMAPSLRKYALRTAIAAKCDSCCD